MCLTGNRDEPHRECTYFIQCEYKVKAGLARNKVYERYQFVVTLEKPSFFALQYGINDQAARTP